MIKTNRQKPLLTVLALLLWQLVIPLSLLGQPAYRKANIVKNKVKSVKMFRHLYDDDNHLVDSLLVRQVFYNARAFPTAIYQYDSLGMTTRYEYDYWEDTLLMQIHTFSKADELLSIARFEYTEKKKVKREIHHTEGVKAFEAIYNYDKKGTLRSKEVYDEEGKRYKVKFEYNRQSQLLYSRYKYKKHRQTTKEYYDALGRRIARYLVGKRGGEFCLFRNDYVGDTEVHQERQHEYRSTRTVMELGLRWDVEKGDVLSKKYFWRSDGLLDWVELSINGELGAVVRHLYDFGT
ncbi:MAG: hypothetical protein AAFV95_22030 [Bacteroidota bacterium]